MTGSTPLWVPVGEHPRECTPENRPLYDRDKLRYPSDLTDAEWQHIGSLLPPATGCGSDVVAGAGWVGMAITSTRANFATGPVAVPSDPSNRCRRHV